MTALASRREMADALAHALAAAGSETVFGVPGGGSNLDVVGSVVRHGGRFVLTHTEASAAMMAAVTAELTGAPGACIVTRGPGIAAAANGAAQAALDRQALLVIADCVEHAQRDRVSHQRIDQLSMMGAICKAAVTFGPDDLALPGRCIEAARAGRPGPVHIDLDPSAQSSPHPLAARQPPVPDEAWREASRLARVARRPVIVIGVGATANAADQGHAVGRAVERVVDATAAPFLTTYKARGVVGDRHSGAAGVATGATIESGVLRQADLVIGVGLDPVELIPAPWPYEAPMILLSPWAIDDSSYFSAAETVELVGDLPSLLLRLADDLPGGTDWTAGCGLEIGEASRRLLHEARPDDDRSLAPQDVISRARELAPDDANATVDAGAHMLLAMTLWQVDRPGRLLISSGLATMGFALPAAIAASVVHPSQRVICFTGDGGLGMVLAELETAARLGSKITVVVFNDSLLSLIAIKQGTDQGGDAAVRYGSVNFAAVATGLGVPSWRATTAASFESAMKQAMTHNGPTLIDAHVDPSGYTSVLDAVRGASREAAAAHRRR